MDTTPFAGAAYLVHQKQLIISGLVCTLPLLLRSQEIGSPRTSPLHNSGTQVPLHAEGLVAL